MSERQLVQHRHAQRLQLPLEDVLERSGAGRLGPGFPPVAVEHLGDDDADHALELAGGPELGEQVVELVRRQVHVLEEQDAAVQLHLPWRREPVLERVQVAADEGRRDPAGRDGAHVRVVGVTGDRAVRVALERLHGREEREVRPLLDAHGAEARAVERGQTRLLPDRHVHVRDVGEPHERLRILRDRAEIDVGQDLCGADAAPQALHGVDIGVGEIAVMSAPRRSGVPAT